MDFAVAYRHPAHFKDYLQKEHAPDARVRSWAHGYMRIAIEYGRHHLSQVQCTQRLSIMSLVKSCLD